MGRRINIASGNDRVAIQGQIITGSGKKEPEPAPSGDGPAKVTNIRSGNAKVGIQTSGAVHISF